MDITKARCRAHSFPFLLGLSAFVAAVLTFGAHIAAAQTADTDGDGYADGVEQQLGSDPNDPESTPESFTLLWTCTDGNDNDRDGKRDFNDPGCRNTAPGSTPAPTATPAPNGPSDSGTSPGGNGSGSGGGSTDGSSDGGGNAVLEGAGAPMDLRQRSGYRCRESDRHRCRPELGRYNRREQRQVHGRGRRSRDRDRYRPKGHDR